MATILMHRTVVAHHERLDIARKRTIATGTTKKPALSGWLRGASRTRTYDPIDVNDVLYRLSHGTISLGDMKHISTIWAHCQPLK